MPAQKGRRMFSTECDDGIVSNTSVPMSPSHKSPTFGMDGQAAKEGEERLVCPGAPLKKRPRKREGRFTFELDEDYSPFSAKALPKTTTPPGLFPMFPDQTALPVSSIPSQEPPRLKLRPIVNHRDLSFLKSPAA